MASITRTRMRGAKIVGKQSDAFMQGEALAWHERNKDKDRSDDPVLKAIATLPVSADMRVLEIGCGDGWRLEEIRRLYGCRITGIDPLAYAPGFDSRGFISYGTAEDPKLPGEQCEIIVLGFCLYLVDREDLFRVVANVDRMLKDGGYLVIHDFDDGVYRRPYKHKEGLFSYHDFYPGYWLSSPAYSFYSGYWLSSPAYSKHNFVSNYEVDSSAVYVLRKQPDKAYLDA